MVDDQKRQQDSGGGILDAHGTPTSTKAARRIRWGLIPKWAKIIAAIVAVVAAVSTILANLGDIEGYFAGDPAPIEIPLAQLLIRNSGDEAVTVVARGDFFLWLPGPGAEHVLGKYEIVAQDESQFSRGAFVIAPNDSLFVKARVLNQSGFGRLFAESECDIAFMVKRLSLGHKTTDNLPFSSDGLSRFYAGVDVGIE